MLEADCHMSGQLFMDLSSPSQEPSLIDNICNSDISSASDINLPHDLRKSPSNSVVTETTMPDINTSRGHLLHSQHQNSIINQRSSVVALVGSSSLSSSGGELLSGLDTMLPNTWTNEEPIVFPSSGSGTSVLDNCILPEQSSCFWEMSELESQNDAAHNNSPLHGSIFSPDAEPSRTDQDHRNKPGVCGLRNLGNTCFMNSGLQCLLNNSKIVQFFLESYDADEMSKETLTGRFAQLMAKVWNGQNAAIKPVDFKEALGRCHPQFRDYRQHDCQEFLALLLDTLHEQLNTGNENTLSCKSLLASDKVVCEMEEAQASQMDAEEVELEASGACDSKCSVTENLKAEKVFPLVTESKDNSSLASGHATSDNSTSTSPRSTDSFGSWDTNPSFRMYPVPEDVKPFQDITVTPSLSSNTQLNTSLIKNMKGNSIQSNPNVTKKPSSEISFSKNDIKSSLEEKECNSNIVTLESLTNRVTTLPRTVNVSNNETSGVKKPEKNELAVSLLNSGIGPRKIPTMEDFAKETKTLNTNVLVSEEINNALKFDSEKFPKKETLSRPRETLDNLATVGIDNADDEGACYLECNPEFKLGSSSLKRVKDTNILQEEAAKELNSLDVVPKRMKIENRPDLHESKMDVKCLEKMEGVCDETDVIKGDSSKKDEIAADNEWDSYRSKNQSVVVDTFQGQFRSTVICSECGYVSVTFEPFMYLAVPLPHALERQISIIYVPLENRCFVRYLVTVHKNDKLYKVKEALTVALVTSKAKNNDEFKNNFTTLPQEMILAEVFDNHISRILEENVLVRHINDANRDIYAFEIRDTQKATAPSNSGFVRENLQDELTFSNNQLTSTDNASNFSLGCSSMADSTLNFTPLPTVEMRDSTVSSLSAAQGMIINEDEKDSALESSSRRKYLSDDTLLVSSSTDFGSPSTSGICGKAIPLPSIDAVSSGFLSGEPDDFSPKVEGPKWESWHSCAICLEDLPDEQLKTHPPCQCILCINCITMSCRHYGITSLLCPVCSVPVKPDEEFIPLLKMEDYKVKVRLVAVPIVFRVLELGQVKLIGHPSILRLPDNIQAGVLYDNVDKLVPYPSAYSLHFVDGQGKNCSRCVYTNKCTGCEVARVGDISLLPGDNLAVTFDPLSMDYPMEEPTNLVVEDDYSMSLRRMETETLTLYDCLKAFSESETLDEQNPWYCPMCEQNRQAIKSLSVWRCPDTLMVYLKRFMFHEFSSTKVDDRVLFPLEGLNMSPYVSGPSSSPKNLNNKDLSLAANTSASSDSGECLYDLQACVCHFGGVSSGHYTAYSKHCVTGEWHYFNDDATREQIPQEEDHVHAYILFYQRPGTCLIPSVTENVLAKSGEGSSEAAAANGGEEDILAASKGKGDGSMIFDKNSDMSPDDGSCSSLCLKPDTITHILKQLEDCGESDEQGQQRVSASSKQQSDI